MNNPNDPVLTSWVAVPPGSDFPIQNLPFGIFHVADGPATAGVAIGDQVLDLSYLKKSNLLEGLDLPDGIFTAGYLNDFFALGRRRVGAVRSRVSELLRHDNEVLRSKIQQDGLGLIAMKKIQMSMPVRIPNYTDFYSSEEHATNVGTMFRDPKNALLPNWKYLPVAYHGRASSIVVSGTKIRRPRGQMRPRPDEPPIFCPTQKLDFELEVAFITCKETTLGHPISVSDAEDFIIGLALFNDWSARDIQQWEYVPLGPFLGKNFASTLSPWIVTLDALEPFRVRGPEQYPHVLPYLAVDGEKNFDVILEVTLQTNDNPAVVVSRTNLKYVYWNINQQLAHHTVNGCNVQVGDIYASGTISGPSPGSYGSLLELTWNEEKHLHLPNGGHRTFLVDGDTITLRGYAEKNNVRIGFGDCTGTILPPL